MSSHKDVNSVPNSSDLYGKDDSEFLEALGQVEMPKAVTSPDTDTTLTKASYTIQREPSSSSDLFGTDDPAFLEALSNAAYIEEKLTANKTSQCIKSLDLNHAQKRKRFASPDSVLVEDDDSKRAQMPDEDSLANTDTDTDIYGASKFHGWGEYMRRKRAKLSIQNSEIESVEGGIKSSLFKGLSFYINGKTNPSVQVLRKLIVQHSGAFVPYLDRKKLVTHIIASNLTPAKVLEFKNMKVATPHWLLESVRAGTLLPWRNFMMGADTRSDESQGRAVLIQSPSMSHSKNASAVTAPEVPAQDSDSLSPRENISTVTTISPSKASSSFRPLYGIDPAKLEAGRIASYAGFSSNPIVKRKMEDPQWRTEHTAVAPGFIEGFYKNSRLHHLSTWKSELQDLVAKAAENVENDDADSHIPGHLQMISNNTSMGHLQFRKLTSTRKGKSVAAVDPTIMHCDFDSFFVSAGLVDRPDLKGKPVVVCHSQGGTASTSEIASSSYEARKFGIRNGMSLGQAKRLCPGLHTLPYEFERYKQFSLQFYTILMSYADELQAVSVDEALVDVSTTVDSARRELNLAPSNRSQDVAKELAETMRMRVKNATGCEVSIGISHNILLARVATRRAKPAGSYHIFPEQVEEVLAPLDIEEIRGFGWSTRRKIQEKFGVTTLGELVKQSKGALCDILGKKTGETLWKVIRGIDDTKIESDRVRKTVSCEINYGIRFQNTEEAETFVRGVAKEASERLKKIKLLGRSLTLKIMVRDPEAPVEAPKFLGHGLCETMSKTAVLAGPDGRATAEEISIGDCAVQILKTFNIDPKELRGIGIHIQKLEKSIGDIAPVIAGQSILPFKKLPNAAKSRPPTPNRGRDEPSLLMEQLSPGVEWQSTETHPENDNSFTKPDAVTFSLPSFSQVDTTVLEALPADIRNELEQAYASLGKAVAGPSRHPNALLNEEVQRSPPGGDSGKGPIVNLARITRQLAPKSRPSISASKQFHPLFAKKRASTSINVSLAELKLLNIDAEVWKQLPADVQREQLASLRAANVGTGMAIRASMSTQAKRERIIRQWRTRRWIPSVGNKAQRFEIIARSVDLPRLRQRGKGGKHEDIRVNTTEEIQDVITQWIEGFEGDGPRQGDVDYFGKYLSRCVETDAGIEKGLGALKWWLILLKQRWKEEANGIGGETGKLWWKAFWEVKGRMDEVARKRFGGSLSLK